MENSYTIVELKSAHPTFEQYRALVIATWLQSLKHGSEFFELVDKKCFFDVYPKVIASLLKRPDCTIRLAVLSDDHDVAIGWSAFEGQVLHFVYVRRGEKNASGRKQGIGTALIPKGLKVTTHMTKIGKAIWHNKYPNVIFNPF
jgi:hypothetical protein